MNNKCFVANMNDSGDTIAGVKGRTGTWIILYSSMIVAVLNFLLIANQNYRIRQGFFFANVESALEVLSGNNSINKSIHNPKDSYNAN